MTESQKLELAQQLSREYGMEGRKKHEESRYDESTGTLFIGSRVYKGADMQRAHDFMEEIVLRMNDKNDASCVHYEIAALAIDRLIKESVRAGGRIVVKDSGEVEL